MAQRKWHKEIKAWADGAEIESKFSYIADEDDPEWYIDRFPDWDNEDIKFRIKPQPKEPQYLYVYDTEEGIKLGAAGNAIPVKNLNGRYKLLGAIELKVNDESTNSY
jgi:hypothetical protein